MMGWPCYNKNGKSYTNCGNCDNETNTNDTLWFEDKLLCLSCHEKVIKPLIDSFTEEYEEGTCDWNDELKCPYCGYDNDSADAFNGGEPEDWECDRCGLEFDVDVEYSHTFQTKRKGD